MIEFSGEMSEKCVRYMLKEESKGAFYSFLIAGLIFCIPMIVAAFAWYWLCILAVPCAVIIALIAGKPPSKKDYNLIIPSTIIVYNDVLISKSEKFSHTISIEKVKKIVDMGDWYHIYFDFAHKNPRFVCDKSLIKKGTIEDFEKLFSNKIIRKTKDN